jgi:hypothetical protein
MSEQHVTADPHTIPVAIPSHIIQAALPPGISSGNDGPVSVAGHLQIAPLSASGSQLTQEAAGLSVRDDSIVQTAGSLVSISPGANVAPATPISHPKRSYKVSISPSYQRMVQESQREQLYREEKKCKDKATLESMNRVVMVYWWAKVCPSIDKECIVLNNQ